MKKSSSSSSSSSFYLAFSTFAVAVELRMKFFKILFVCLFVSFFFKCFITSYNFFKVRNNDWFFFFFKIIIKLLVLIFSRK